MHLSLTVIMEKIGPLEECQEESDHIKMRHCSKDAGIDFTCELQYEELKTLVRHRHFTMNVSNALVTSHSLLHSNLNDEVSINQDENGTDNVQDTMLNSVFFNANKLKHLKVISITNDTKVKVIEHDILSNNTIGNEMEFDKNLATTLIENECS